MFLCAAGRSARSSVSLTVRRRLLLPFSLADLDRGRTFYARQSKNVGDHFLDSLFSDSMHMKVLDFHRLLAKRFPYGRRGADSSAACVATPRVPHSDMRRQSPGLIPTTRRKYLVKCD